MSQPPDPFATPAIGPTPFAAPTSTAPVCPKCGWHQPDGARSCAACGLIFARYAEAERRRIARAAADAEAARAAEASTTTSFVGGPTSPAGVALPVGDGPVEIRVGDVLGAAAAGTSAALWPLVALQFVPVVVAVLVGITAATTIPALLAVQASTGVAPLVVAGVLGLLFVLRVVGGIVAGTLVAVDDAMEGNEGRGALATIGEGWARGGRALSVSVLTSLAMLLPAVPLILGFRADVPTAALSGLGFVAAGGACVLGVRLALALPLAVLGQRDTGEALSESWALTSSVLGPLVFTLLATIALTTVVSLLLSLVSLVPVLGWIAAFVGQAGLAGFSMAVIAALFRRLVPREQRYG